ncbi:hypothetical protein [Domibacillus iocasae]|uniref:Lipoprotein n=1 Tax=Domibacillus iocasae TaxID=1714016 RepID=A0A1E7DS62_9BACI|nr:hypothetical protein [Domibacillus iocasae]OES45528.1 hypothetical protein BA724_01535 [Domibacillus iocasae]
MKVNWIKPMLIGGVIAMLTLALAGCGNGEDQQNEGNNGQEKVQQNNHSDINEGTDRNNDTGTNENDQIEADLNDEK